MREARFVVRKEEGRSKPWCVEVSARHSETGKRQRHFFATKEEAIAKQADLRNSRRKHGETFRSISATASADAVRALELLEPWPKATLLDAAKEFAEQRAKENRSDTVGEILSAYHSAKENKSPRYVNQIHQVMERLSRRAGDVPVATFDVEALEELVEAESPWTRNINARILKAAVRYAYGRDRIPEDLSAKIHLAEVSKSETRILTVVQASKLMKKCDAISAPIFALRLFAGIRAEEATRLPVEDIDVEKGEIYIRDYVSKVRGHDRIIPMEENLKTWLTRYPPGETLIPAAWERLWDDVREKAGLKQDWPQNVLRHSFSAYWLGQNGDLDGLAQRLGHFGGLQMLRRHYYRAVRKTDAEQFWAIMPKSPKK